MADLGGDLSHCEDKQEDEVTVPADGGPPASPPTDPGESTATASEDTITAAAASPSPPTCPSWRCHRRQSAQVQQADLQPRAYPRPRSRVYFNPLPLEFDIKFEFEPHASWAPEAKPSRPRRPQVVGSEPRDLWATFPTLQALAYSSPTRPPPYHTRDSPAHTPGRRPLPPLPSLPCVDGVAVQTEASPHKISPRPPKLPYNAPRRTPAGPRQAPARSKLGRVARGGQAMPLSPRGGDEAVVRDGEGSLDGG